jgi:hypothetical protein
LHANLIFTELSACRKDGGHGEWLGGFWKVLAVYSLPILSELLTLRLVLIFVVRSVGRPTVAE